MRLLPTVLLISAACAQSHRLEPVPDGGVAVETDAFRDVCPTADYTVRAREATAPIDIVWMIQDSCGFLDIGCQRRLYGEFARVVHEYWEAVVESRTDVLSVFLAPPGLAVSAPPALARRGYHLPMGGSLPGALAGYDTYERWLRSDSELHLVVVSLADTTMDPVHFRDVFREMSGRDFTFHAVVGTQEDVRRGCETRFTPLAAGANYAELARLTGGLERSICGEYSDIIEDIAETAIERRPLPCEYTLPQPPPRGFVWDYDPALFEVSLELEDGASNLLERHGSSADCGDGWWYFEGGSRVVLCPRTCRLATTTGEGLSIYVGCPARRGP